MRLEILLPFQVYAEEADVLRVVVDTTAGSCGIYPHRRDCVAALVPGILMYETLRDGVVYLALDEGVMVKTGADLRVSVRHAIGGASLSELHGAIAREFLALDTQQRSVRAATERMESDFLHRLTELHHGR